MSDKDTPKVARIMKDAGLPQDFAMGGQAVIEGVMMRGPERFAVAVRKADGDISVTSRPFWPVVKRKRWLKFPVVRGAVSLVEMLTLGYKALDYSAQIAEQDARREEARKKAEEAGETEPDKEVTFPDRTFGGAGMALVFALSMALAMLLFVALPNASTHWVGMLVPGGLVEVERPILFNLVSGLARVLVLVAYISGISMLKDVRRLFQYHGAEHKVVMAFEKGIPLNVEAVRPITTIHPRCGTTFIAIVLMVSIVIFTLLAALIVEVFPAFAGWSVWLRKPVIISMHILFMPVVAGLAYEFTRRAGKRPDFPLYRLLLAPGMAFQKITTREPDDSMIEVSIRSFGEALTESQREKVRKSHGLILPGSPPEPDAAPETDEIMEPAV